MAERGLVLPRGAAPLPAVRTAKAWVLVDLGRGTVLAAGDPHGRYQPASVLKTLTAVVLTHRLTGRERVPISQTAADTEGSAVGLVPGGSYTADILFRAMLMMSGNDATEALVGAAGGDTRVVAAMNDTVRGLGGYDTVARTPTGLDTWDQLTSAYDLALVLRAAVGDARLMAYDATRRALLPAQTVRKNGQPVGTIEINNQSGDFLDRYPGAVFAKTGFTDAARHTFLAAARRGDTTLGVVYLRAERAPLDQWQQASALLDWGFRRPHTAAAAVGTLDDPTALATRAGASAAASATAAAA
ncbi:D-alanyl-D-alanine carboxypeptidase family protein, partial [Jatrophihabitans sp. YIM 134969]